MTMHTLTQNARVLGWTLIATAMLVAVASQTAVGQDRNDECDHRKTDNNLILAFEGRDGPVSLNAATDGTHAEPRGGPSGDPACLIISEVVTGAASGACPKWIEVTNTGVSDYLFTAGGIIVQMDGSTDVVVDVDLTGETIAAGQAFVVNSNYGCSGAFYVIYGQSADFNTTATFGDGDDRYILTDTNDGSNLLDIYGEFGVDGTGESWEYTSGYSYRLSTCNTGNGGVFDPNEWFLGGVGSLTGGDPEQLLRRRTTPFAHAYDYNCHAGDMNCDGLVNGLDISAFVLAVLDPAGYALAYPGCNILNGDFTDDGDVDDADIGSFVNLLLGG